MKHRLHLALLLVFCPALCAQQSSSPFSSNLVQWSYMQQGQVPEQDHPHQQPTPEPVPETQPPQNPTPPLPDERHAAPSSAAAPANAPVQTFTGFISKEVDSYVLKISAATSYKLDNQQEVQQYEGRRVRVTGTLDTSANLIHVDKVEPLT